MVTSDNSQQEVAHVVRPLPPEGPAALPAHIVPVGEHQRLAGSTWWIGYARPAYEEVTHLQGIVIYNRNISVFLSREEAAHMQTLLPVLIEQGPMSLESRFAQPALV